jgi:hypothetical protein
MYPLEPSLASCVPGRDAIASAITEPVERRARMRVMVVHHTPSLTQERYEAVVRGLTGGKPHLESISDVPTDGLLAHAAAQTEEGFVIFDVFESQEAFDRFRAIASPIATEAGIQEPPKSYPLHTYLTA